ncbi:hypothetical protein U3516DRAFT_778857 [Neocallimastix sp. 'constans']
MNNSQLKLNKKGWVITLDISMAVVANMNYMVLRLILGIYAVIVVIKYIFSIKTLCCSSINISSRIKTYCICMTFNNNHRNIYKHRCKMTLYDLHISVDIFALFIDKITAVLTIKGIQNHHIATLIIKLARFQIVNKHIGFYGLFMPNYAI